MLLLIILLVLLFGGGGGYFGYSRWGRGGGLGVVGTVLVVVVLLYVLGGLPHWVDFTSALCGCVLSIASDRSPCHGRCIDEGKHKESGEEQASRDKRQDKRRSRQSDEQPQAVAVKRSLEKFRTESVKQRRSSKNNAHDFGDGAKPNKATVLAPRSGRQVKDGVGHRGRAVPIAGVQTEHYSFPPEQ
jgi:hypothetical protein